MAISFEQAILTKKILVCVGSGGVGKTTTAASLALAAARRGKKTLVLTIDPAKRLANSLGLADLGHQIAQVAPDIIRVAGGSAPPAANGELHAMMLDQQAAFDDMVKRHAKDAAAVTRILKNPVYAQISKTLAGAQEYAAMTKLQEFYNSGQWDLIVVDTPPTAHALDFLDAPRKLSEAIDSPAIEWFRKLQSGSQSRWSLVGRTGAFVINKLAKFVGSRFLDDIGVFLSEFNDILGGFRQRAEEVFALLRQPQVGFVLVASPEPMAVQEAMFFHERLAANQMPFVGFAINKVHVSAPLATTDKAALQTELTAVPAIASLGLADSALRTATDALVAAHTMIEQRAAADGRAIEKMRAAGGPQAVVALVPFFRGDIHEVSRLVGLEHYLVPQPQAV